MKKIGSISKLLVLSCIACGAQKQVSAPDLVSTGNDTLWEETTVKSGETLSQLCEAWELPQATQFAKQAKTLGHLYLRQGEKIKLHHTLGPVSLLKSVEFPLSSRDSIFVNWNQKEWSTERVTRNFQELNRQFSGRVETSLWASAEKAGMDTDLLLRLSEVFAWVLDFSREIKAGDEWRLVATEYMNGDKHMGWKDIRIAEYKRGTQIYQAFGYEDAETGRKGFFTALGESMEKLFLKSPIKFGHISSRFARKRFHPILQVNRPHLGVDYAAPTGTPIMAVGDGVVEFAAFSGGGGRIIKLRHNATYTTAYKHLSRFAAGLHVGKRVVQGDIIGYVGTTGLSTGPHLHFEFLKNGVFVDPQGLKFPAAVPLKVAEKNRFQESIRSLYSLLPQWPMQAPTPIALREVSSTNP